MRLHRTLMTKAELVGPLLLDDLRVTVVHMGSARSP